MLVFSSLQHTPSVILSVITCLGWICLVSRCFCGSFLNCTADTLESSRTFAHTWPGTIYGTMSPCCSTATESSYSNHMVPFRRSKLHMDRLMREPFLVLQSHCARDNMNETIRQTRGDNSISAHTVNGRNFCMIEHNNQCLRHDPHNTYKTIGKTKQKSTKFEHFD